MNLDGQEAEYFAFFPHVQAIRGIRGTAVYDLFRVRLFWFPDEPIARALALLADGVAIDEVACIARIARERLESYLSVLATLGLGTRVPKRTAHHLFRPIVTRGQAQENGVFQFGGTVTIELASECIYRCPWCTSINALTTHACSCGVWPALGPRLSQVERTRAIERLAEQGKTKVVIRGGEPLLHWEELSATVAVARQLGMDCEIHSTGVLLDQSMMDVLAHDRVQFVLLCVATSQVEFDRLVQRAGSWASFQNAAHLLRNSGTRFSVKVPTSIAPPARANEVADWAANLGASGIEYILYAPPGQGYGVSDLQTWASPAAPQDMAVGLSEFYRNVQCQSCLANACCITADGLLTPCIADREALADLHTIPMTQVLREDRLGLVQESTARRQVPGCAQCEFRFGCSACLIRTRQVGASPNAPHWNCNYTPTTATWGSRRAEL